jgi:outer membrane protein assembly factor BamB
MSRSSPPAAALRPRLRVVPIGVLAAAALALAWLWLLSSLAPQWRFVGTYVTALITGLAVGVWWLLLSGVPWRRRLVPVGVVLVALGAVAALVRVRGVTGDWKPVLEWRFGSRPALVDAGGESAAATADRLDVIDVTGPAAFPGFLGPNRDSTISGLGLAADWVRDNPEKLWQRPVGAGWGGIAIAGRSAYTLEQRGENEAAVAYDLDTGNEVWRHEEPAAFSNPIAGPGPRTTPAVTSERVFTLGATGLLWALDRRTGELLWRHDVVAEHGARIPEHGKTSSPLLVELAQSEGPAGEGLVVISAGGPNGRSLVAYRQADGGLLWTGGDDRSGYASPVAMTLDGERQIVSFNAASVTGHAISDGRVLWSFPWSDEWPNVAPPLQVGPRSLVVSTGYGIGISRLDVRRAGGSWHVTEAWHTPRLKAKFTNLVFYDGFVYGLDEGVLVCLDPETGERRWRAGRYGHGNLLLADDLLFVQTERGEIKKIAPSPTELVELGQLLPLQGKAWNHFAIARPGEHALLAVRNDREMALWRLPLEG